MLPNVIHQSPLHHQAHGIITRPQGDIISFSEELASVKPEKEVKAPTVPKLCMSQMEPQTTDANQPVLVIAQPADTAAECLQASQSTLDTTGSDDRKTTPLALPAGLSQFPHMVAT